MGKKHWLDAFEREALEHVEAPMKKIDESWLG
jgi:hypothetical protein